VSIMQQATEISAIVLATELGAPGRPDPRLCAGAALKTLAEAAGPDYALSSFSLDIAPVVIAANANVRIEAKADKRTRSIAFLSLKALADEEIVFSARAVFSANR
jgi:hypothetical protein